MDFEGTKAAILKVEQAVTLMDNRLQHKLRPEQREALANAILNSGAQDDLLFHHRPVRKHPPLWTLGGLVAALRLQWARRVSKIEIADEDEQRARWAATVRRSGARRLLVAMLIALVCGVIGAGLPVELLLQVGRDKLRPVQASGEIVVVAKDERSRQAFGQLPWSRRYDAMLLDRLRESGASRIVFYEMFDRPLNPLEDAEFIRALQRAEGKVWLSSYTEADEISGLPVDFMPMAKFKMNCCLVSSYVWFNPFGYVDRIYYSAKVGGAVRPSSAQILANGEGGKGAMRPDSAIQAKSVPTISAYTVLTGAMPVKALRGKSVIIGRTSSNSADKQQLIGQPKVSDVYVQAVAAETIRNGAALDLGWLLPFIAVLLIGLLCVTRTSHRERMRVLFGGFALLLVAILVGDRSGYHVEIVPALLAFTIFGMRDHMQRKLLAAASADPVSGLPCISELTYTRKYDRCIVAALKVERFPSHLAGLDPDGQRDFVRAVAARINIIFPDQVVHQGEEGLFVWLISPEREYDPLSYIAQLTALFRLPIGGRRAAHDVGVAIGFGSNLNEPFAARLAVATDRARVSLFGTLTSVQ